MAKICGSCNTERMFTLKRGDKIICVDCHDKEILSPHPEHAEGSSLGEWISVDDRLPDIKGRKNSKDSWIIYNGEEIRITCTHPDWWNKETGIIVTHWMPLPAPPMTGEGEGR